MNLIGVPKVDIKLQPHDLDIEKSLLGCLLLRQKEFLNVESYLFDSKVWYIDKHRRIWAIIKKLHDEGEKIDIVTVSSRFKPKDNKIGLDSYYLTGLTSGIATPAHAEAYARRIYEHFLFRKTMLMVETIYKMAKESNEEVYSMMDSVHTIMGELIELKPGEKFDLLKIMKKAIKEITANQSDLINLGYPHINEFAGGLTKGEVTIVGGRPGHGKTTFLLNVLSNLLHQGYKVLLINRELTNEEVLKKLLCIESGKLSYRMMRNSQFTEEDIEEVDMTWNRMKEFYSDEQFCMFDHIRDFPHASLAIKKFEPDIVLDDYIQLIDPPKTIDQRRLQLEYICNNYKWLAKHQKCSVILASQLNRGLEARGYKNAAPQLSDLAESGAIEQIAENVFFTYYEFKHNPVNQGNSRNKIKLVARKVRYGETGSHILGFDGDKCKIYDTYQEYEDSLLN